MDMVNQPLSQQGNKYEVFLSYSRGEDESFSSRVYSSLREDGISIVKDVTSSELLQSIIEASKISIIIFSKHYASSKRCLEELTKIMEFRRPYYQVVLPIFYGVDKPEVCNQESSFGEAFRGLIQRISPSKDEGSRWRTALKEAGRNHGFVVPNFESIIPIDKSGVIQNIVKRVRHILDRRGPFATEELVGVSSRQQDVITELEKRRSKDVVSIGIWGMWGIGKTTLAKVIFNHIHYEFETTCFLSNVRENWKGKGKVNLQKKLLSTICEETAMAILDSFESATLDMKERHFHKKILLVLDDVDDLEQLDILCGNRKWFGQGSVIIITTRNSRLLNAFRVDFIYSVKELNMHDSLELFCREAFKQASPKKEYTERCRKMVDYSQGLPLALRALSSAYGWFNRGWKSVLKEISKYTPPLVSNTLKFSLDSLDDNEKEIFLNIVVFYIGEDMNDVIQKMDDRECHASIGMRGLVDRSLITIDNNNKIRMHNMLQVMGRQIMRQSSQNELLNRGHRYEVFLSFRGEDTRSTFTSHLYAALCNAGIIVFKDDVELKRGKHIKTELLQAIGSSKIAIIIFSREYAASKWCLEELSIIMELHKSNDQVVLPVFYHIDPSEIRSQTSSFGKAFRDLIQRFSPLEHQVSDWRIALDEAGGLAGTVVFGSRDESEYVKAIVENVCDILDKKDLFVADHPVGVDSRVQEAIRMLQNHQSEDVIMVGIWGMGGTGKTTIGKAIYNEIGHTFDCRSFLSKIRKVWHQKGGKVRLQNQLLSEICKTSKMKINDVDSGKIKLSKRLCHKKALVVLDNVDKPAQLKALVGNRDWFQPGSTIIITTRNRHLLSKMDCHVYMMKNLNEEESIELFSWHAFKQESPEKDFIEVSKDIVAYSGGLPLALEVLGSYLFDREVEEWKRVLERLKKIPHNKIQKKLQISFDGLEDLEKEIFLDISCFFIGMDINDVAQILNGCKFFADIGIKILMERSLLTVDEKNKLGMHDLLRDMGREIIRKQAQKEPGKRNRLWFHKDAQVVLQKQMGTKAIEGLSLKLSQSKKTQFQTEAFKKMKRLRLLCLDNVELKGDYKYIRRDELRWLCWQHFPKTYIPRKFYQKELVAVDLKSSNLRQVWKETELLKKLKFLNLSHSLNLVQTPNFLNLPNLETLILKNCPELTKIHHSIGLLHKLLLLDLEDCTGLRSLPRSIYRLKCLKTLILSGCKNIEKLEEDIEQMKSLTTLIAPTIKQVPFSLVRLKSILYLSVNGYEGLSHQVIPSLYRSWMSSTNNPLPLIPTHVGMPSSILWDMLNNIHGPSTIPSSVPKQQSLLLEDGWEIPHSLGTTPNCVDILRLQNCLENLLIQIGKNSQVFHMLSERVLQGLCLTKYSDDICILPGDNYPYWLTFMGEGASVKFEVPPINGYDHLKEITICCVYIPSGDLDNKSFKSCIICLMIKNYTKGTTLLYTEDKLKSLEEAEKREIISNLESDDQVEVKAIFGNGFIVKKTAVYLIYTDSFDEKMETSTFDATNLSGTKHKLEKEEEEEHQSIRPRKVMKI